MFRIGEFSRLTQVTVKALRHYDHLGLLKPAHTDAFTGYRFYSSTQLSRLNRILALKDLGLPLEQIGQFLDADLSSTQLHALLLAKQAETRRALEREEERLARIAARLRQIEEGLLPYDVVVKRLDEQRVASIRRILPNRNAIGDLFRALFAYRQRHGLSATAPTAIWHDPDYRASDVDAEATFATTDPLPPDEQIMPRTLPAVETIACVVHQGAPDTIGPACLALLSWVEANGYQVAGPERVRSIERYGPSGQDTLVEMQLPVVRATTPRAEATNSTVTSASCRPRSAC